MKREKEPQALRRFDFEEIPSEEATAERLNEYGLRGFAVAAVLDGRVVLQREIDTGTKKVVAL